MLNATESPTLLPLVSAALLENGFVSEKVPLQRKKSPEKYVSFDHP